MKIRKKWRTEGPAHVVRNCSTDRCSMSIHGHTYHWELVLSGNKLDNAGMLVDFGLLKGEIGMFFDAFDHSHMMWDREGEFDFFYDFSERFIGVPFSPSAENMALFAYLACSTIMSKTQLNNGEGFINVESVRVHETETGWAEAGPQDAYLADYTLDMINFKHWPEWRDVISLDELFIKSQPRHQITVGKGLL